MQTALTEPKKSNQRYPNRKFDLQHAFKLRFINKLSYGDIAKRLGVRKNTVHDRLTRFMAMFPDPEEVEVYEKHKVQFLTAAEFKLIEKITDEDAIKEASLNNAAYAFQQINNANRLEKGLATSIYDSFNVEADLADLQKREAELMKEIQVKVLDNDKSISQDKISDKI